MTKAILGALFLSAFSVAQASAVTIDFTNNVWNPGFSDSQTVGNTTVESVPAIPAGILNWDSTSGFGVSSWGDLGGQVGSFESLNVSFAQTFTLSSFAITELVRSCFGQFCSSEVGYYRVNGAGAWTQFTATSSNGNLIVNLAPNIVVSSIQFGFDGATLSSFRVKSLTGDFSTQPPSSVPEPTSMVLLGTGLLGLAARARRKKA